EEEHDERPLEVRLGSAAAYAAELRTAAGLPPRQATGSTYLDRARSARAWLREQQWLRDAAAFIIQLRPAWWLLRGYLLVLVPCMLYRNRYAFGHHGRYFYLRKAAQDFPVPSVWGSHLLGLLAALVAIVASVKLGRASLARGTRVVVGLAGALLVTAALVVSNAAFDRVSIAPTRTVLVPVATTDPLSSGHGPVTNIFPFGADGRPLDGVLLYDQDGRPLRASQQEWWPDGCARVLAQPKAADGVPVAQSYPQQYVLDPRGVTMDGLPVGPGQCRALPVPKVSLPIFPKTPR
ncbi:MAG: hypothetical protein JWN31_1152, partial [Frankiales bacterium]|nr:hypothetical protein [Frankiales bacterium]